MAGGLTQNVGHAFTFGEVTMRPMIFAIAAWIGSAAIAQEAPLIPVTFEWPAAQSGAIPDLRVSEEVRSAESAAREARSQATIARRIAAQEKRRAGLQGLFGVKPSRATTDGETIVDATRGRSAGSRLGTITYAWGSRMTGSLSDGLGVYEASADSPLSRFSGFVLGATGSRPFPTNGIFEWKNGDTFTGSLTGSGGSASGIYVSANGDRKFVGVIDMSQSEFRPLRGNLLDQSGKLLAVVNVE